MTIAPRIDKSQAIGIPVLTPDEKFASANPKIVSDADAAVIGFELVRMERTYGVVTPEVIVCEARNEAHPLHRWFTWDDTEAADRFRRIQARRLAQVIVIVSVPTRGPVVRERAVLSVVNQKAKDSGGTSSRSYVAVDKIKTEPALLDQVRADAWRELRIWANKYRNFGFTEFDEVFRFYDEHHPE